MSFLQYSYHLHIFPKPIKTTISMQSKVTVIAVMIQTQIPMIGEKDENKTSHDLLTTDEKVRK